MKLLSVLMFIIAFTLEVRVHANDAMDILETPQNCLESNDYCVIKNMGKRYQYKHGRFLLSLSPESIVIRQSEKHWSLVKGQVFVKSDMDIVFDIPYGKIEISKGTQAVLDHQEDKVAVQTIFGKTLIRPIGSPIGTKGSVIVASGYENYVSKVDESLKAQTGIPKPILVEPLLKIWAFHTASNKRDFLEEVREFKTVHEKAVSDLSILNQQIVSREISSAKEKQEAEELRRKRHLDHKKQMQQTYYERLLQNHSNQ